MRISPSRIEAALNRARTHVIAESLRRGWGFFALIAGLVTLSLFPAIWPMRSQGFVVGVVESNGGQESEAGSYPNIEVRLANGRHVVVLVPRGITFPPNSHVELEAFASSVPFERRDYRFRRQVGVSPDRESDVSASPLMPRQF